MIGESIASAEMNETLLVERVRVSVIVVDLLQILLLKKRGDQVVKTFLLA